MMAIASSGVAAASALENMEAFAMSAAFTMLFAGTATFVILKVVNALVGLRVSEEDESLGLDLTQHGESAYND